MLTKNFSLTEPITLDMRMSRARITVHAVEGLTTAEVRLSPSAGSPDITDRCTVELNGTNLRVSMPKGPGAGFDGGRRGPGRGREGVDAEIVVPSRTALHIRSFLGTISADGRLGAVDIAAGSVDVDLDHADGPVRVRQGSGRSALKGAHDSVVVRSGSGDVQIGEAAGSVDVVCASGNLVVGVARAKVRLRAGSGSARLDVANGDVDIVSGSGGVAVGLPAGQVARLDIATGSGQLRTDLPVDDRRPSGGNPITVKARTGSGDILIARSEPSAAA